MKILIIDDKPDHLTSLKACLLSHFPDAKIFHTESGEIGLNIAIKEIPDTILLETFMPEIDGYEVCKKLKANNQTKYVPIIMLSEHKIDAKSRVKGLELGVNAFIIRPFDDIELISQIKLMFRLKTAEDKLRSEEEKLKQELDVQDFFPDLNPSPVFSIRYSGEISMLNRSAEEIIGYKKEEVIGKSFFKLNLLPSSQIAKVKNLIAQTAVGQKTGPDEFILNQKGGGQIHVEISTFPIKFKKSRFVIGIARDISERKKTEKLIEEYTYFLKESQRIAKIGSYQLDFNLGLWDSSDFLNQLFGIDPKTKKDIPGWLSIVHPKDREMMNDYLNNLILQKRKRFNKEYRILNKENKKIIWVHGLGEIKYNKPGKPITMIGTIQDITERKASEEYIKRNERRLSLYINQTPMALIEWDPKLKIQGWNPAAEKLFSYSFDEAIGKDARIVFQKNKHKSLPDLWNQLKSMDGVKSLVYENNTKNGKLIKCRWHITPLLNDEKEVIAFMTLVENISDSVRAEQIQKIIYNISNAVITSESLNKLISIIQKELNTLFDATNLYVAFYNEDSDTLSFPYMSDEKNDYKSFPAEHTISKYLIKEKKPLFIDSAKARQLEKEGIVKVVGALSKVYMGVPLFYEGKVNGLIAVQSYKDENAYTRSDLEILEFIADQISIAIEKKLKEERLIQSENRFDIAMKASKDGLYDWDLLTNNIYFSESWKEMLGYSDEELPNTLATWERLSHSEEKDASLKKLEEALLNKVTHYDVEFRMKHKDGHWVNILSKANIIYDKDGRGIRAIGTHSDMTQIKKTEQTLKDALKKAQEADRLKSTFLATMSHELRTPLNAIIGFSDIISDEFSVEEIVEFNKTINNSGKHLLNIVEDLFDMTLIETGEVKIYKESTELNSLLNNIHDIIKIEQKKLNKEQLSLKLIIPSEYKTLNFNTDPAKLKQVLLNLLKNALKFTPDGFIKYGYEVKTISNKTFLELFVQDSGIGIPEDKQELIFEMFRQAEDSKTREFGGTGIGLSISRKLTHLLGGEIRVESNAGEGTTFYCTFPYESANLKIKDQSTHKKEPINKLSSKTILIVEDMPASYEYLKIVLERIGMYTEWAEDGQAAIKTCKINDKIDLVLMDINMPVMNGLDATKAIKKFKPDLPIIAQTAYAISGDKEKTMAAGCDDYISKPIKKDALIAIIEKFLIK